MADETTPQPPAEITNFAQFEAAGGKYNAPPEPAKPAAPAEPVEAVEANPEADTAEQPEADKTEKKPPKPKPSLSEEHAKLLKEVTELRRQRR
jgi:outer membrane biosynthesis protein TonB